MTTYFFCLIAIRIFFLCHFAAFFIRQEGIFIKIQPIDHPPPVFIRSFQFFGIATQGLE